MPPVSALLVRSALFVALGTIDFFVVLGVCSALRIIRISVNWVTWIIGSLIMFDSALLCLSFLFPLQLAQFRETGSLLGVLSFLVAVYAAGQWVARQWFVQSKKSAVSNTVQAAKTALVFLRTHHEFFGWVVVCAALAHTAFFLPHLTDIRTFELVTGFVALGILAVSVLLGLWMWFQQRMKKRLPQIIHNAHALLTIAFFVVLFMHM